MRKKTAVPANYFSGMLFLLIFSKTNT